MHSEFDKILTFKPSLRTGLIGREVNIQQTPDVLVINGPYNIITELLVDLKPKIEIT